MKWPESLTLVRHDTSAYNDLKPQKEKDPLYRQFVKAYEKNPDAENTRRLALEIKDNFSLNHGDHDTPLATDSGWQAEKVGEQLKNKISLPHVIFVSPYMRTQDTLTHMIKKWPELKEIKTVEEERIREQDHGLTILYNDWRVFNALNPEQRELYKKQGEYWYRFPQGENVPDVRERLRSWAGALTRDYNDENVLAVTHHLSILSLRANLERLGEKDFLRLNSEEKPINAGVTIYRGVPTEGREGRLKLETYNAKLY